MAYATIMVYVEVDAAVDARIDLAAGLADRFESTLMGIAAWAPRSPFVAEGVVIDQGLTDRDLGEIRARLDQRGHHFRSIVARASRQTEWRSALEFPTDFVVGEARGADLVIIGREQASTDIYRSLDPGKVLLMAGRPVLVVPSGLDTLQARRIAVAWKDTREARRALADALPFMCDADKVLIVEVREERETETAQRDVSDIMNYLTRHRIMTGSGLVLHAENVTDELLRIVRTEQIDLLVGGAYGHSRLGEWVFGGVTRELLQKSSICCLFSH